MVYIRLLGVPAIEVDGQVSRAPRGRKAWAVLAYLLLADRAPSRRQLAEMLFADADDPLGAVRWTLGELRRCLGAALRLYGDPLRYTAAPDTCIDLHLLADESADPAALVDIDGELLDGLDMSTAPIFDSWLIVERHRLSALREARLRQAAIASLAGGSPADAVVYASRVVTASPLEEGNHEMLIRALAMSGDHAAAQRQMTLAEDLIRRELGVAVSPALRDAAAATGQSPMTAPSGGRAAALSELEAGRAAVAAGAVEAGLQCLRRAVAEAERCQDPALTAEALNALGGALVHAARGRDEEGSILLRQAVQLAEQIGEQKAAIVSYRELGYIEVQAGRRQTADAWLAKADALAETDEDRAAILGVRGMNSSDRADYPAAFAHLRLSVEHAERAHDRRQQAWSLSLVGRAHLLRGEPSQATAALARSLDLVREERWIAFLPWPQTLLAELTLADGNHNGAADTLEQAWHLARQLNDACWEGMAARGLGLLCARRGQLNAAEHWLTEAATRSTRLPDRYQWVHAHVLDTVVQAALDRGDPGRAQPVITSLSRVASRCDMRELVVRAHVHRYRTGDRAALQAARHLVEDIDNPALTELVNSA